jgi:hypothetical protein
VIRRDYYANPWRDHARQNGIQTGRMTYRDLHGPRANQIAAVVLWALLGLALWALALLIVWRVVELLVA